MEVACGGGVWSSGIARVREPLCVAVIAGLILAAETLRRHAPPELAVLGVALVVVALTLRHLYSAFRTNPANFPASRAMPSVPEEQPPAGYRKGKELRRRALDHLTNARQQIGQIWSGQALTSPLESERSR